VLVEIAQAYGILLGKAEERISIDACSPLAAKALSLAERTPVLVLDRAVMTRDGRPAEWRRAECMLNEMHYMVELK